MTIQENIENKTVDLTLNAAEAVRELLTKRNLEDYSLRIFIQGGGCSGFQYGMALDNNVREQDKVIENHGVQVIIDEVSLSYMQGATIDYVNDAMGSGFKIDNPNLIGSCCGSPNPSQEDCSTSSGCAGCG